MTENDSCPVSARESYAKLNANTGGPHHQGQTSREAQTALDEIDQLRRWKSEAIIVLNEWEDVWQRAGRPGPLGESKAAAVRRMIADAFVEALGLDPDMSLTRLREDLHIASVIRDLGGEGYIEYLLEES